jgi:hypothetical protein
MRAQITGIVLILTLTAGCARLADSRINPFNWFGGGKDTETTLTPNDAGPVEDGRPLIDQVTSVRLDRAPGGAIITATGLPPTQGYYVAALLEPAEGQGEEGVLVFNFRALPPPDQRRVSTERSREITVGEFISDQTLANTRAIRIQGSRNARTVSR